MDKKITDESLKSRRSFIKKAAYAAPAIIALGSITKPVSAAASGPVTVDPNLGGVNTTSDNSNSGQAQSDLDEAQTNSPF